METTPCNTIAGHHLPQRLGVDAKSGSKRRDAGGWRKGLPALPVPHCGLKDSNLGGEFGLRLWPLAKQFAKLHAPYLADHLVASIAIYLESARVDFADIFRAELKRHKFTHASFAERVGVSAPFVSLIATRKSKLPMDRVGEWATALGLTKAEREVFAMYAGLAHIPDRQVAIWISERLETLERRVIELVERARRLQ